MVSLYNGSATAQLNRITYSPGKIWAGWIYTHKLMVTFRKPKYTSSGVSLLRCYHALVAHLFCPARNMLGFPEQPECTCRYNPQINGKIFIHWRQEGAKIPTQKCSWHLQVSLHGAVFKYRIKQIHLDQGLFKHQTCFWEWKKEFQVHLGKQLYQKMF